MGFDTLYYFISIALLFGSFALVLNMIFYRKTSKTIFGQKITKKDAAYESMRSFTSNKNVVVTSMFVVIFLLNLWGDIARLLSHYSSSDVQLLIWIAPCISAAALALVFADVKKKIGNK